jgi:hypothetical protein
MSARGEQTTLADVATSLARMLAPGAKAGLELLGSVSLPSRTGCGCEIPPPCWVPQPLGDRTTEACAGSKAVLRLHITNCGFKGRTIQVAATNKAVKVAPASLALGPLEDGVVVLSLDVPEGATQGQTQKTLVFVRGCKDHYLRWTVEVAGPSASCSTDLELEDCPDLVHHWYDHFYCQRPCLHRG